MIGIMVGANLRPYYGMCIQVPLHTQQARATPQIFLPGAAAPPGTAAVHSPAQISSPPLAVAIGPDLCPLGQVNYYSGAKSAQVTNRGTAQMHVGDKRRLRVYSARPDTSMTPSCQKPPNCGGCRIAVEGLCPPSCRSSRAMYENALQEGGRLGDASRTRDTKENCNWTGQWHMQAFLQQRAPETP